MFHKEEVQEILAQARHMDPGLEIPGVSEHQYKLKPPVDLAFVRAVEEEYHFRLPAASVPFLPSVFSGGAGPGYGLSSFGFYRTEAKSAREARMRESYLSGLSKDPQMLPLEPDELEYFCITEEDYQQNPGKYFGTGSYNTDNDVPNGFFHLGTYGCARDYGLITCGERHGQIFINDIEGAFELEAGSFQAFYQDWLDFILDTEGFRKELKMWRGIRSR